jgi:hypothetical protein
MCRRGLGRWCPGAEAGGSRVAFTGRGPVGAAFRVPGGSPDVMNESFTSSDEVNDPFMTFASRGRH